MQRQKAHYAEQRAASAALMQEIATRLGDVQLSAERPAKLTQSAPATTSGGMVQDQEDVVKKEHHELERTRRRLSSAATRRRPWRVRRSWKRRRAAPRSGALHPAAG